MQLFQSTWQRLTVLSFAMLGCLYGIHFIISPSLPNFQQWASQQSQSFSSPNTSSQQQQLPIIPTIHSAPPNVSLLPSTAEKEVEEEEEEEEEEGVGFITTTSSLKDEHFQAEELQTGATMGAVIQEGGESDDTMSSKQIQSLLGEEFHIENVSSNSSRRQKWEGKNKGTKKKKQKQRQKQKQKQKERFWKKVVTSSNSMKFRNASWLPEIGAWLSQCASSPPFRVTEIFRRNSCANNCSGRGVCNLEFAECRCFHGYTGAACELEKVYECNLKHTAESDFRNMRFGPYTHSICSASCDKTKGFCYCGEGTKYPRRPVTEKCGFPRVPGTDWEYDWTRRDPVTFAKNSSGYGWCNVDPPSFYAKSVQLKKDCYCTYEGNWGYLCEINTQSTCHNQCSGNGVCREGFCACSEGWHGIDCSVPAPDFLETAAWPTWLSHGVMHVIDNSSEDGMRQNTAKLTIERHRPLIYVYDLPPEFNSLLMEGRQFRYHCVNRIYDVENRTVWTNQLYGAENALLEGLLASKHRTTNAEEADFFYVPVMGACAIERADDSLHMDAQTHFMGLRTYFSGDLYREAYEHIKSKFPYWDRSEGRDHIWLFPWDEGACVSPKEIWNSMMLVHWGNTHSKYNYSTSTYPFDNWDAVPQDWRGTHPCYDPQKDLVIPSWKLPDPDAVHTRVWERQRENRPNLFYFRGNLGNKYEGGRVELNYSMGIRQRLAKEFGTNPNLEGQHGRQSAADVKVFSSNHENYSTELASSRFCGVLPGDGWSGRMEDSILHGCIPVIIQDGIHLPFENMLDYRQFAVRIAEKDLPKMVDILRSIPDRKVDAMQSSIQGLWQRFTYHNSIKLQADQDELRGKSQRGKKFVPATWATEYKTLTDDDAFATFIQVLHFKLSQQSWRTPSRTHRNASNVDCRNYSYRH